MEKSWWKKLGKKVEKDKMNTETIIITFLTTLISSGIAATFISRMMLRGSKQVEESVRVDSEKNIHTFSTTIEAKEKMLNELIGPVVMHLYRTERAFKRYKGEEGYLEAEVLYKGNKIVRDLLLQKGYLLDATMIQHAVRLIEHYDVWLEEYEKTTKKKSSTVRFVFSGPSGYPFPKDSEEAFIYACSQLKSELYGNELNESV